MEDADDDQLSTLQRLQRYFVLLQRYAAANEMQEEEEGEEGEEGENEEHPDLVPADRQPRPPCPLSETAVGHEVRVHSGAGAQLEHQRRRDHHHRLHAGGAEEATRASRPTLFQRLHDRELQGRWDGGVRAAVAVGLVAEGGYLHRPKPRILARFENQLFCGRFSEDGDVFVSACQDRHIRIYDAAGPSFRLLRDVGARDVGWSILDTDISPDRRHLLYSSWSDFIHLVDISDDAAQDGHHEALDLKPRAHRFCVFSLQYSHDGSEVLAGSSDQSLYIYDLHRRERTLCIDAHSDDINSVSWADETSHILFSASDDCLCKVWDRRALKGGKPVGVLVGHLEGITHVSSKRDGRYLITNSKDQSIKLWDLRSMRQESRGQERSATFDYRYGDQYVSPTQRKIFEGKLVHANDCSINTYRGAHKVFQTLVRCYFSPAAGTGQRYIISGSHDGAAVIYDLLSAEPVARLQAHKRVVRDVAWHPHQPRIVTTSWDGTLREWVATPDVTPMLLE